MELFFCYNCKEEKQNGNVVGFIFDVLNNVISVQECGDLFICCPTCNTFNNVCDDDRSCNKKNVYLEIEDYVQHPMLWCDDCGALVILLKDTVKMVSKEYIESKNPNYFNNKEHKEILDNPKSKFVSVTNAFIKKFTPNSLSCFESKKQLSSDETSLFSEKWNKFESVCKPKMHEELDRIFNEQSKTYQEYMNLLINCENEQIKIFLNSNETAVKYGITHSNFNTDDRTILNISVDVNSYDINKPTIPYVQSIKTHHDGCHIYVLCENEKGEEFTSTVWGD